MRRALVIALCLAGAAAPAQDAATLADIRADLAALRAEIGALQDELSEGEGGGAGGTARPAGPATLERVDAIERELQRLTGLTEELQFRIEEIVRDGTNRIGDLEFRLCELEPGCDISALGETPLLGGDAAPGAPDPDPAPDPGPDGPQLAVDEQADFDAARAAFDAGDWARAAALFADHVETYPGGPLSSEADFLRGAALGELGQTAQAARAYLDAFSRTPDGPRAPEALLRLGEALGTLGQTQDACITLGEVGVRFPGSDAAGAAEDARARLECF